MEKINKKQKSKKGNKGFSLVEILAVVVILGVVSTVGIVSVSRLIENSKKHYYESQQNNLILAARAYVGDHKEVQPRNIGEKKKIYLKTLYDNNYIKDKIVDNKKVECNEIDEKNAAGKTIKKGSYVNVVKSGKTEYSYKGYLYCKSCGQDGNCEEEKLSNNKPVAEITFPPNADDTLFEETTTIDIKYLANGDNAKIASYSYKIYVDGKLIFNSGTKINGKRPEVTVHEPVYKYLPGVVKVVATITNTDGDVKSFSKSQDYKDAAHPSCEMVKYDMKNIMNTYDSKKTSDVLCGTTGYKWTNDIRHVWVLCNDKKGIGCAQTEFSKYLDTEGADDVVSIKDTKNEPHNCAVKKCIDRTTPKITVKIYKSDKNGGKDGGATKTFTVDSVKAVKTTTKDEKYDPWLNKNNYPYGVIVEVTITDVAKIATAKSEIKSIKWYQNVKNQKENAIGPTNSKVDEKDNLTSTTYTKSQRITDDGVRKQNIVVTDYAGNITTYNLTLKIDRTPPPVPNIYAYLESNTTSTSTATTYPNNTWKSAYSWTNTNHPKDNPDVSGWRSNQYTTTGAHGSNTNKNGNSLHINKEGKSTIKYRSCDNADNCSGYSDTKTIKLDRTNPVCKIKETGGTKGNNGWYRGGTVTATGYCTDQEGLSGCTESSKHVQTISSNTAGSKKTITFKDHAGNSISCSNTIKYDKSAPSCSIPSHGWTEGSVSISTNCSDNGPSGVTSCKKTYSSNSEGKKTHTVTDNAGNSNTCSTTVSSKRQQQSCTACDRCKKAGCKTADTCTKSCCGVYYTWEICHAQGCDGITHSGSSCPANADYCKKHNDTCTDEDCCGCKKYKANCSYCGCASWGSWTDVGSCSESTTSSSKTKCRTMYKNS